MRGLEFVTRKKWSREGRAEELKRLKDARASQMDRLDEKYKWQFKDGDVVVMHQHEPQSAEEIAKAIKIMETALDRLGVQAVVVMLPWGVQMSKPHAEAYAGIQKLVEDTAERVVQKFWDSPVQAEGYDEPISPKDQLDGLHVEIDQVSFDAGVG